MLAKLVPLSYVPAPRIIPAPFKADDEVTSAAKLKVRSSMVTVVEFTVVCVPSTWRLPLTTTVEAAAVAPPSIVITSAYAPLPVVATPKLIRPDSLPAVTALALTCILPYSVWLLSASSALKEMVPATSLLAASSLVSRVRASDGPVASSLVLLMTMSGLSEVEEVTTNEGVSMLTSVDALMSKVGAVKSISVGAATAVTPEPALPTYWS